MFFSSWFDMAGRQERHCAYEKLCSALAVPKVEPFHIAEAVFISSKTESSNCSSSTSTGSRCCILPLAN